MVIVGQTALILAAVATIPTAHRTGHSPCRNIVKRGLECFAGGFRASFVLLGRWQCQHQFRDYDQRGTLPFVGIGRRLGAKRVKVRSMALDFNAFGIIQSQIRGDRRKPPIFSVARRPLHLVSHRSDARYEPSRPGWHSIQSAHVR